MDTVPPPHLRPLRATVCTGCPARLGYHPEDDFEELARVEIRHFEKDGCRGSVQFERNTAALIPPRPERPRHEVLP